MTTRTKQRTALTIEQRRAIYCVEHGHTRVVEMCFGYVSCARCNQQIGDTLAGVFDLTNHVVRNHDCEKCRENARTLTRTELAMLPPELAAEVRTLRAKGE